VAETESLNLTNLMQTLTSSLVERVISLLVPGLVQIRSQKMVEISSSQIIMSMVASTGHVELMLDF